MQVIARGTRGTGVAEIRASLVKAGHLPKQDPGSPDSSPQEADFDESCERALRAFQQSRGLLADGVVGPETWRALLAARYHMGDRILHLSLQSPMVGDDILAVQERLLEMGYNVGRADGVFGLTTHRAIQAFQRECGMNADGVVGPETMHAFHRLARKVVGGKPQLLRENILLGRAGPQFSARRIVVDAAHGGDDPGHVVHSAGRDYFEAEICYGIASRIQGRIAAIGGHVELTRTPERSPSIEERAEFANRMNADVFISLHCDWHTNPEANGVATYHFGSHTQSCSAEGERLAGLVQREILSRTQLTDCRIHPKSWDTLRLTRMPAVHIELGYLSNPSNCAQLASPGFQDTAADGIVAALQRSFLPIDAKVHTGALDLSALRVLQQSV